MPWQKAASDDPRYVRYLAWQGTVVLPIRRTPKLFKLLSSSASRMFRRFLEPRVDKRPKNLSDLTKFVNDRWLAKNAEKDMAEYEPDELCPSMYSFHSSPDEKNKLLYSLVEYGIETIVDRQTKKNRISDWIESSVITEEDEVWCFKIIRLTHFLFHEFRIIAKMHHDRHLHLYSKKLQLNIHL